MIDSLKKNIFQVLYLININYKMINIENNLRGGWMKKCLGCGYECADNDNVCPMCGRKFGINVNVENLYHQFKSQFNAKNQQQSSDDFNSTVESNITNNDIQESKFSHLMAHNEGNKILNSLWILISFIPFISGFGIIYAGKKTSKKSWIFEGVLYELPVIFHFVLNSSTLSFSLVFLSLIISIIRSLMILPKYRTMLNVENYKKLDHKILSFILFLSSLIPFLNGIGFIYFGNKYSKFYLMVGVLFEMLWVLEIISLNFIPINLYYIGMLFGIATASLIISGMSMISFNFDCDALYHYANNSTKKINENDKKYIEDMYDYYKNQLNDVKEVFDSKEEKVRDLIKQRFGTGNITSNRFLAIVDNSHENVYKQLNYGNDLINYTSEPSQQVEEELLETINYINSINDEMEKLTVELILKHDVKSDDNIDNLINDMEDLIDDVNKYE